MISSPKGSNFAIAKSQKKLSQITTAPSVKPAQLDFIVKKNNFTPNNSKPESMNNSNAMNQYNNTEEEIINVNEKFMIQG